MMMIILLKLVVVLVITSMSEIVEKHIVHYVKMDMIHQMMELVKRVLIMDGDVLVHVKVAVRRIL